MLSKEFSRLSYSGLNESAKHKVRDYTERRLKLYRNLINDMLSKRELDIIRERMKLFPREYKIVGNRAYTINDFTGEWTEITGTESSKPMKIKDAVRKGTIKLKKFSETEDNDDLAQVDDDDSKE